MPNGAGLNGGGSRNTKRHNIPVPGCCSNKKYFVFTVGSWSSGETESNAQGLNYSLVDLTLNGGLGDVVAKNISLVNISETNPQRKGFVTEKLTATEDGAGGYWVLAHGNKTANYFANGQQFYAFHITNSSIGTCVNPIVDTLPANLVISTVAGTFGISPISTGVVGQMKFSSSGKKIACAEYHNGKAFLFDFDPITGIVLISACFNSGIIVQRIIMELSSPKMKRMFILLSTIHFLPKFIKHRLIILIFHILLQ